MDTSSIWNSSVASVTNQMQPYVLSHITPIAEGINYYQGTLLGTGSYWEHSNKQYIISCEHVSRRQTKHPAPGLSHLPIVEETFIRLFNYVALPEPEDLALFSDVVIPNSSNAKRALTIDDLALTSNCALGEVLFICGYPAATSTSVYSSLSTTPLPFAMQEVALPNDPRFSSTYHFAISYPPSDVQTVNGGCRALPSPEGLSGSPVWNTGFVEGGQSQNWKPSDSKVIGIAWFYYQDRLIVTRIEKVRDFLLNALRKLCAQLHWQQHGSLDGGPGKLDVDFAMKSIPQL